jgi:hypothetical protein
MTSRKAASRLEAIRNDRTSSSEDLIAQVDEIGQWVASQKYSTLNGKLLEECHQLHDRLNGGNGKHGTRLQIA